MKFSKIACVALLSASISTVALAQPNQNVANLIKNKESELVRTAAYNKILKAVNELGGIYSDLKTWTGEKGKTDTDINTKIYNALKVIKDEKSKITENGDITLTGKDASTLKITSTGNIKLQIQQGADNTAVNNGGGAEITIALDEFKNSGNIHDKINAMFAENNKDVWESFVEQFKEKHNEKKEEREGAIDASVENIIKDYKKIDEKDEKYTAFVENKDFILNNIQNNIKKEQANVTEKQKELNKAIADAPKDKLTLNGTDKGAIKKQETDIKALANKLTTAKGKNTNSDGDIKAKADALIAAIDAGVKLQTKANNGRALTKEDINGIKNGTAKKDDFDNGGAQNLSDNTEKAKVLDALIGNDNNNGAQKAVEAAKIEIEKVTRAVIGVTTAEADLASVNKLMASANKVIAEVTSSSDIAGDKLGALNKAITEKKPDQIAKAQQELKNAANARATGVTKVANLEEKQGEVLGSFTDTVLANDTVKSIVTSYNAKELADTAKALNTSIEQSQRSQNKGTSTDIIMFNTGLATNTRLAKLSNPFNADLALAQAINELEGETFADAGDSLSSVIKEYTNRFNHDNNLWGNIFGGKGKIKDSANPSIWGVTLGYDKAFDNTIVGGFINYAKVQSKDSQVRSESDNYSFGVYSRSYFDQSEIDAKIGYGFGRNELSRHAMDSKIGTSTGKYDSKFFDVDVEYGYVFGLGNAMFIKPIAGLSYTHIKHDGFTEDGNVPAIFGNTTLKTLKAKLGSEFRVYTDNAGYFYITPGVERELSKSANDLSVKFVGSSKDVVFDADKKKNTYITLKTGAEFKITNNLSTNINFGAKAKAKEQYYNGTLGVSYKF
ncbi:autotransporter domain-containing protein [Campylobacter mucosalis]|uniref:autotransporter outer membrane beta-barrel domain-containing protein n=1 Tax=Campylobacter mucosalis TaxID=202 RepID=UPI001594A389|nr:autotransporter outer membrane beta-barrel domain-containing protein [Campylobacter mucosalis]QKF62455.1 autotransporter domain-containing protein [Campylobacter mucosalis]